MTAKKWANLDKDERMTYLLTEGGMTYKEAWEINCDDMYDLPYEIASCFTDFDEAKWLEREGSR